MTQLPFTVLQPYGVPSTPGGLDGNTLTNYKQNRIHVTGSSYTLKETDSGSFITFEYAGTTVLTIPATLGEGFSVLMMQKANGTTQFSLGTGGTNLTGTNGLTQQSQFATLIVDTNIDGSHAEILVASNVSVDAPSNGVLPVINGSQTVGSILTASTGIWSPTPAAYTYQWKRDGVAIAQANDSAYVLTDDDYGALITVTVTATNANGSASSTSSPTAAIQPPGSTSAAPVILNLPQISGTASVGATLTVTPGTWTNSPTSYAYQWKRSGVAITNATAATYVLVTADAGTQITCTVTATNANGSSSATSSATSAVTSGVPVNTVLPVISGATTVGQTLSTTNGTWDNSPSSYAYQWKRDGSNIGSATNSTYVLQVADATHLITVTVTATNAAGSTAATSAATAAIGAAGSVPANTVAPAITGTTTQGQTLTVSNGTWTNTPTSYTYQWNRAGTPIASATASTYILQAADVGFTLTCTVTATNGSGNGTANSAATATIAASTAWAPTDLGSVLTHWYDAKDSATITVDGSTNVSAWTDKSGNGRNLAQATAGQRPAYNASSATANNQPTISATGSANVSLQLASGASATGCYGLYNDRTLGWIAGVGSVKGRPSSTGFHVLSVKWDAGVNIPITTLLGSNLFRRNGALQQTSTGTASTPSTSGGVFVVARNSGGDSDTVQYLYNYTSGTTALALLNATTPSAANAWAGELGEIIICVGTVSQSDMEKIEGYLAWKWNLNGSLPTTHPYYSAAP